MRIALDVMGGDFAPKNEISGAIQYIKDHPNHELILIGDKHLIQKELDLHPKYTQLTVVHADQAISMKDSATAVLKTKKESSMAIGLKLHKDGVADAFVSAGNTGAQLAFSGAVLRRIKGVKRAGIGAFLPNVKGFTFIMDVGANVDCKPEYLFQFAVMSDIMCRYMYKIEKPTLAVLSIGEEESKGNDLTFETTQMIKQSHLNFFGNIEGRDVLMGTTDIMVCDGFVGNIVLKMAESIMKVYATSMRDGIGHNPVSMLGGLLIKPAFNKIKKIYDYQTYGGVPLLGVNGISIICHGKSTPLAICNAIKQATSMFRSNVNKHIEEEIEPQNKS